MLRKKILDGEVRWQFQCPKCGTWGYIDDDQFHGRVSMQCVNCDYHETVNLCKEKDLEKCILQSSAYNDNSEETC